MSIENQFQWENTRHKVEELESLLENTRSSPAASEHARELTIQSIRKRINQFREEMLRFEAHASPTRKLAN